MIPRPTYHEVVVIRIVLLAVAPYFPWSPRILLIPKTGDIEIWHGSTRELVYPCFLPPELVIVGMPDKAVPVGNGTVQVAQVEIRQGTETQIPIVGIVSIKLEMRVCILVRLLHHRVFDGVTFAQGTVSMAVIVHPLV